MLVRYEYGSLEKNNTVRIQKLVVQTGTILLIQICFRKCRRDYAGETSAIIRRRNVFVF